MHDLRRCVHEPSPLRSRRRRFPPDGGQSARVRGGRGPTRSFLEPRHPSQTKNYSRITPRSPSASVSAAPDVPSRLVRRVSRHEATEQPAARPTPWKEPCPGPSQRGRRNPASVTVTRRPIAALEGRWPPRERSGAEVGGEARIHGLRHGERAQLLEGSGVEQVHVAPAWRRRDPATCRSMSTLGSAWRRQRTHRRTSPIAADSLAQATVTAPPDPRTELLVRRLARSVQAGLTCIKPARRAGESDESDRPRQVRLTGCPSTQGHRRTAGRR